MSSHESSPAFSLNIDGLKGACPAVHFKREESVMAACNFPGLEHHKDEHRDFVKIFRSLERL